MNSSRYFEITKAGMFTEVGFPVFGKQDIGITPGGAMDLFSLARGNLMLNNPVDSPGLEILFPPELKVKEQILIILTGAKRKNIYIKKGTKRKELHFNKVYHAEKEDIISMGEAEYGLRSYLCFTDSKTDSKNEKLLNSSKAVSFGELSSWVSPTGKIRVIKGPEYDYLENLEAFFNKPWKTTHDMNNMGMRINNGSTLNCRMVNMISEAVSTGTIQLTPKGPIILLRHRQTIGGYPRIFSVINADIDLLGQYAPDQLIRFEMVGIDKAHEIYAQKKKELDKLKNMLR